MSNNKYDRACPYPTIDVYRVLEIFNVTNPAIQHAVKKLLCTGIRGGKDFDQDLTDAIDSLTRGREMRREDAALGAGAEKPRWPVKGGFPGCDHCGEVPRIEAGLSGTHGRTVIVSCHGRNVAEEIGDNDGSQRFEMALDRALVKCQCRKPRPDVTTMRPCEFCKDIPRVEFTGNKVTVTCHGGISECFYTDESPAPRARALEKALLNRGCLTVRDAK